MKPHRPVPDLDYHDDICTICERRFVWIAQRQNTVAHLRHWPKRKP